MNKTQKNQRFLVSQRPKSFRKLIYIFAFLVAGLFVVSACEEIVGRRVVNRANVDNGGFQRAVADQGARNAAEDVSGGTKRLNDITWDCSNSDWFADQGTSECNDEDMANKLIDSGCTITKMECVNA